LTWSKVFDANSLVVLRKASVRFDAEKDMARTRAAGVSADYVEIDSDFGRSASGLDAAKWAPWLKAFMAGLGKRS